MQKQFIFVIVSLILSQSSSVNAAINEATVEMTPLNRTTANTADTILTIKQSVQRNVEDGISKVLGKIRFLGNEILPNISFHIFKPLIEDLENKKNALAPGSSERIDYTIALSMCDILQDALVMGLDNAGASLSSSSLTEQNTIKKVAQQIAAKIYLTDNEKKEIQEVYNKRNALSAYQARQLKRTASIEAAETKRQQSISQIGGNSIIASQKVLCEEIEYVIEKTTNLFTSCLIELIETISTTLHQDQQSNTQVLTEKIASTIISKTIILLAGLDDTISPVLDEIFQVKLYETIEPLLPWGLGAHSIAEKANKSLLTKVIDNTFWIVIETLMLESSKEQIKTYLIPHVTKLASAIQH
jgi:hypothetical protein